jgi:predicted Zn-dependent protease
MAGLLVVAACAINPVSGRRELALVSEAQEIEMGREGAAAVAASIGLHSDAGLQNWVNAMGQKLAATSERPELPWEFKVVDDASVNAFALPGGFIFVTRGLLTQLTSEAELASVIGHEIGHVTARHSVQQMSREQLAGLALGVGSVLSPTVAKYGQVAGAGLGLLFMKYGRDDETQSDRLGFRYALTNGYDTREMANVFRMFQQQEALGGGGRLPEWQSSHPDPGNRVNTVQRMVSASGANFDTLRVGEPEYLRRLNGMVYGENPRLGFFIGSLFVHPDLRFTMRFPDGWQTRNSADAVLAVSREQDAMVELRGARGSAVEAAQAFFTQEGLTATAAARGTVHGNNVVRGGFTATMEGGATVRGVAQFIEYGGQTWQITAYTASQSFDNYAAGFDRAFTSFARLTDATALGVQPHKVELTTLTRAMTLTQLNAAQPSSISLAELAMINGVDATQSLPAGRIVKRVTGTPLPKSVSAP